MPETPDYRMSNVDLRNFERLTEQESHSVEGQIAKMDLIEQMLREGEDSLRRSVVNEIRQATGASGGELAAAIGERMQTMHVSRMQLGDGRYNLIVEKGDEDPENEDSTIYRVMIPAHVDTVKSGAPTQFIHEPMHPDRVRGLGVYDMAAGVLNNIDLAVNARVPKGMKVYFVFTVDEEKNSIGARELIKQWDVWPLINSVVSSEIGPVDVAEEGDHAMRLITARAGRVKMIGDITVDHRHQGHGSERKMPNASKAKRHLQNAIDTRFYDGYRSSDGSGEFEPAQQREHPLLGQEEIEDGADASWMTREGYFPTDRAQFELAVRMVSPSTREEYAQAITRWAKGIAKKGEWKKWGINHTIGQNPNLASYSPYELPADHPLVRVASETIQKVTGLLPKIVGAPSVADECDYAEAGKPVITIPPNGDEAHHPDEWVSMSSTMRIREVIKRLIEEPDGLLSLREAKA
jgi:acetylornithine deacetylase/succinyl-diaminopimelate desuccinylase-like protein